MWNPFDLLYPGKWPSSHAILSFGIKQQLFKSKAAVSMNAHNILQSENHDAIDRYSELDQFSYFHFYTRSLTLSFNWWFGSDKSSKIKIKSGSEEEQKRTGD